MCAQMAGGSAHLEAEPVDALELHGAAVHADKLLACG